MPAQSTTSIVSLILTFLSGGAIGTLLGHWFAIGREKTERRRNFLGFMGRFRSEAERATFPSHFTNLFTEKVHQFREETGRIRPDLPKRTRAEFDRAVSALCALGKRKTGQYGYGYVDAKKVCTAIDDVLRLVG